MLKLGLRQNFVTLAVIALVFPLVVFAADIGIEYTVEFEGVHDGKILAQLEEISDTVALQKSPVPNLLQLRRRARRDEAVFAKALHAEGYYASSVTFAVEVDNGLSTVKFSVDLGPQYFFTTATVELTGLPDDVGITIPKPDELGVGAGKPALARVVVDVEQKLLKAVRNRGFPLARVLEREVVVDHAVHSMEVNYRLDSGPYAYFGPLRIRGLEKVKESVVTAELPWQEKTPYNDGSIDTLRKRLYDTGLFSVVRIKPEVRLDENQSLPYVLELTERKHRSVWAGGDFDQDEGLGVRTGWEHRNIQGLGRRLLLELRVDETRQEVGSEFHIRHFKRRNQTLRMSLEGGHHQPEAFETTRIRASVMLERKLMEHLTGGLGVAFTLSEVEQFTVKDSFRLVSLPVHLNLNRANSLLDPTRGFKVVGRTEPFFDLVKLNTAFLKSDIVIKHYLPLDDEGKLVLATRLRLGSILGVSTENIPADVRFYAGGGGSIRGYPFQKVGPLVDDEPAGGRSLFEFSAEFRYRFAENFGIVAFVDGGSAFESTFPGL